MAYPLPLPRLKGNFKTFPCIDHLETSLRIGYFFANMLLLRWWRGGALFTFTLLWKTKIHLHENHVFFNLQYIYIWPRKAAFQQLYEVEKLLL